MIVKKISGKQVNLLIAKFIEAGIQGEMKRLEWIEDNCFIEVVKLEDINIGQLDFILAKMRTTLSV